MEGEEELEARGSRLEPCLPGALKGGRKEGTRRQSRAVELNAYYIGSII